MIPLRRLPAAGTSFSASERRDALSRAGRDGESQAVDFSKIDRGVPGSLVGDNVVDAWKVFPGCSIHLLTFW